MANQIFHPPCRCCHLGEIAFKRNVLMKDIVRDFGSFIYRKISSIKVISQAVTGETCKLAYDPTPDFRILLWFKTKHFGTNYQKLFFLQLCFLRYWKLNGDGQLHTSRMCNYIFLQLYLRVYCRADARFVYLHLDLSRSLPQAMFSE